ncbi:unnamed protein product [Musa banksii]
MMKTVVALTPTTASSRTRSASAASGDRSEARGGGDSCYFPGCRKDTNCHCDICLASIHATRDLVPSLSSKPKARAAASPVPFLTDSPPPLPRPALAVTPPPTPPIRPSSRSRPAEKRPTVKKQRSRSLGYPVIRFLVGLFSLWAADSGFSAVVLKSFSPKMTPEAVAQAGEKSRVLGHDLKGRLELLQQQVEKLVGGRVSNCSSTDSYWEMNQLQGGHFLFQWRCVIYKSMAEKVSVWGSPLRTTGLLASGASPRSITILSGKITEWPDDGKLLSTMRTSNSSSWRYEKWRSAALHLDANTWVLEYERNAVLEGPGLIPAARELLRLRVWKKVTNLGLQQSLSRLLRGEEEEMTSPT